MWLWFHFIWKLTSTFLPSSTRSSGSLQHCFSSIKPTVWFQTKCLKSHTHGLLWVSYHSSPPCAVNNVCESIPISLWVTAHRLWKHEKEDGDKVRENLEAEQKGRRKVGRLGCSPTPFVPSTLLLFLCPRSAVASSRESAGRTTSVRNFTKQRRNPVILHRLWSTLIAF